MRKNLMCFVLTSMLTIPFFQSDAQSRLGDPGPTDPNAVLEIASLDKGLVVSRLPLIAANNKAPMRSFSKGMVVYNTATSGSGDNAVTPGMYICDGTRWIRLDKEPRCAVRVKGPFTFEANNTSYPTDHTATPTELVDNLNEFSGSTFKAAKSGLYHVIYTVRFIQDPSDRYIGLIHIKLDGSSSYYQHQTVDIFPMESGAMPCSVPNTIDLLIKLNAGQVINFGAHTYAATGLRNADYNINVFRVD